MVSVYAYPTSMVARDGSRGVLLLVKNEYKNTICFKANEATLKAPQGRSRHLVKSKDKAINVIFETGEEFYFNLSFSEPKEFKVYVVPTNHMDWGYTDLQENVAELHKENMKKVINAGKKKGTKFVVEVLWQALDAIDDLRDLNVSGIVGMQAFPLNILTGLCNHEEIVRMFYPLRDLRRKGFRIEVAALNDIPTAVWGINSVLAQLGIKYYIQAVNPYRGPLFEINKELISPFIWIGPDGSEIISWFSGGYKGPIPWFHGYHQGLWVGMLNSLEELEAGIAHFLYYYDSRKYPYKEILLYGMFVDNSPYVDKYAEIIGKFNEKWITPILILAKSEDFFKEIEKYKNKFSKVVGDFGTYWEDGAASAAKELALSREVKKLLYLAEVLYTIDYLNGEKYPKEDFEDIWKKIFFFDEHTWSDAKSVSDPFNPRVLKEEETKANFIRLAYNRLINMVTGDYVVNPYPFSVEGILENTIVKLGPMKSIPIKGITKPTVELELSNINSIENDFFMIRIKNGKIVDIYDKEVGVNMIDPTIYSFDEFVYVLGGKGTLMEKNIHDYFYEERPTEPHISILREYGSKIISAWRNDDVIGFELEARGHLSKIRKKIIMPTKRKEIIVENIINKAENFDKEGIYFSFPFKMNKPKIFVEEPGVFVDIENEQVLGACKEWFTTNNIVLLRGDEYDIAISSDDAPLITVNDIFRGLWKNTLHIRNGLIFSYVMNNYWDTNFKAAQGGLFRFRYRITSGKNIKPSMAWRFFASPFIAKELIGDLSIEPPEVIVSTIKKWDLGEGVVVRLLEVDNEPKIIKIKSKALKGFEVYKATILEELTEKVAIFNEELEIPLKPRSYTTLVFVNKNLKNS
ncbi:MAG: glycosyl hydrolase-related protein [Thermoproteota archaeon]